jgi:F-type H+-transporting ATPase subunit a
MEKFEHPLLIVHWINKLFGPLAQAFQTAIGHPLTPDAHGNLIEPYMAMVMLIVAGFTVLGLVIRSRISVENPGKLQIILEDVVGTIAGMLTEWLGPQGVRYLPLIGTFGLFILAANYIGLVPGFMSPTSSINVTVGCAITTWIFYHLQGFRTQGVKNYLLHFVFPPGVPKWLFFIMLPIELISHTSRILSLSLRLFGNIFGEELVILILGSIIPFIIPVPMMLLGLITGGLQAFIFVLLSSIYLQGAVAVEHVHDQHGHDAPSGIHAPAAA